MPDEYVRTGRSTTRSSSAKATISSISPPIARARAAVDRAVQIDVLAAAEVRMEAGAELEQRGDPAADLGPPEVGLMIPAIRLSSVVLPEPLRPTGRPPRPDRPRAKRPCRAQTSVAASRLRATTLSLSVRDRLRVDAEVPAGMFDADLTRVHAVDGTAPRAARTIATSTRDEGRVVVRHLDPPEPQSSPPAPARRLGVEIPTDLEVVGDEPDRADENLLDPLFLPSVDQVVEDVGAEPRLPRRRLALVRERPFVARPRPPRRAAPSRSSWSRYGSPSSRIRAGSECAVKTTCASRAADPAASSSTNPGSSCQLSTNRQLRATGERVLEQPPVAADREPRVVRARARGRRSVSAPLRARPRRPPRRAASSASSR